MQDQYQQSIAGLESSDAEVVLNSAIWLVENPEYVVDQSFYATACELLQSASQENVECLRYIADTVVRQLSFKAQLLASLMKDAGSEEVKIEARRALEDLIEKASAMKTSDTEVVAQIYSAVEESGDARLIEKSRNLLK